MQLASDNNQYSKLYYTNISVFTYIDFLTHCTLECQLGDQWFNGAYSYHCTTYCDTFTK